MKKEVKKAKIINIEVHGSDGEKASAQLMACPECEGEEFFVFFIEGVHQHLQCTGCRTSICSGTCADYIPNTKVN